jgi:hypothetical protein
MGRPKLDIDPEQVRKLAAIGCTNLEIADIVKCSHDTLTARFKAELDEGRSQGKASIRRKQYELAMSGNATMLIWLGKQVLNQKEKTSNENTGKNEIEINLVNGIAKEVKDAKIIVKEDID